MDEIRGIHPAEGLSLLEQSRSLLQAIRDVRSGKVEPTEEITETLLRYKLDMDERGVLKSATPSQSILAVTNQEQANVRRLSEEAAQRGEDVVAVDIDYSADIVDGKLVIRAGRTEVASRPRATDRSMVREYERIGEQNRDAAQSSGHFDIHDDASMRSLSGGLSPAAELPDGLSAIENAFEEQP